MHRPSPLKNQTLHVPPQPLVLDLPLPPPTSTAMVANRYRRDTGTDMDMETLRVYAALVSVVMRATPISFPAPVLYQVIRAVTATVTIIAIAIAIVILDQVTGTTTVTNMVMHRDRVGIKVEDLAKRRE